jgi:hypothetical protein
MEATIVQKLKVHKNTLRDLEASLRNISMNGVKVELIDD